MRSSAVSGICLLLFTSVAAAQPAKLPDGLRHVPVDALGFIHIRAGAFLQTDLGKQVLQEVRQDREAGRGLQKLEKDLGLAIADIDTITLVMLTPPMRMQMRGGPAGRPIRREPFNLEKFDMPVPKKAIFDKEKAEEKRFEKIDATKPEAAFFPVVFQERDPREYLGQPIPDMHQHEYEEQFGSPGPLVIVSSTKALDRKKILRAQHFSAYGRGMYDQPYAQEPSAMFLSDRTVLLGVPWELGRYSEMMARNPGPKTRPLESALALGANGSVVVAGGQVPAEVRRMMLTPFGGPDARALATLAALLQTQAGLSLDIGKNLDVTLAFNAPTEASAEQALQAVKNLRVLAEVLLEKGGDAGESGGWKLVLEKRLKQAIADATIEQKELSVRAQLKMELDPVLVKRFTKELVSTVRQKGDRTQSVNNLKNIGLALHSYHDANKRLPAAGISSINDPNGKPILSWRVAILPYIDQQPLYQQFDLTLPWDHPHNKKLIPHMPQIYMVPGADSKEGMTHYRVLVGPQTAFEPGQRITLVGCTDGTSNTILAVEANEPTIWTRPDDLPFNPNGPLPKFGVYPEGFNVLMGDATVRYVRAAMPEANLRGMITRNGGEVVTLPD